MKSHEFLKEFSKYLSNSSIKKESMEIGSLPRIYGEYNEYHVKLDFVVSGELIIEVLNKGNRVFTISRHTFLSRILGKIFGGVKTCNNKFNSEFMIINVTRNLADLIFTSENISRFIAFKPFEKIEFSVRDYKVKKIVDGSYTPEKARIDLDRLIELNKVLVNSDSDS